MNTMFISFNKSLITYQKNKSVIVLQYDRFD